MGTCERAARILEAADLSSGNGSYEIVGLAEQDGDRCYGDPAQDYIASCALETGEGRRTQFRHTAANGDVIESDGTVHGVKDGSCKVTVRAASKPSVMCEVEVTVSAS